MNTDLSIISLQKHRELLQMEYEYDKKCFEHQSGFMSVDKKVAAGIRLVKVNTKNSLKWKVESGKISG